MVLEHNKYRKVPKFSDAKKLKCNLPKIQTKRPNFRVFSSNDANGIANSEDPDQTAGSALFAQTYLSEKVRVITVSINKGYNATGCCGKFFPGFVK